MNALTDANSSLLRISFTNVGIAGQLCDLKRLVLGTGFPSSSNNNTGVGWNRWFFPCPQCVIILFTIFVYFRLLVNWFGIACHTSGHDNKFQFYHNDKAKTTIRKESKKNGNRTMNTKLYKLKSAISAEHNRSLLAFNWKESWQKARIELDCSDFVSVSTLHKRIFPCSNDKSNTHHFFQWKCLQLISCKWLEIQ